MQNYIIIWYNAFGSRYFFMVTYNNSGLFKKTTPFHDLHVVPVNIRGKQSSEQELKHSLTHMLLRGNKETKMIASALS